MKHAPLPLHSRTLVPEGQLRETRRAGCQHEIFWVHRDVPVSRGKPGLGGLGTGGLTFQAMHGSLPVSSAGFELERAPR